MKLFIRNLLISLLLVLLIYSCSKTIKEVVVWHERGKPKVELQYLKGQKDSLYHYYEYYYNDSIRDHAIYENGVLHGERMMYYRGGKKWKIIPYFLGNKHGKYLEWFQDGDIKIEGQFVQDERHESWLFYDSISGNVTTKHVYHWGLVVNYYSYD